MLPDRKSSPAVGFRWIGLCAIIVVLGTSHFWTGRTAADDETIGLRSDWKWMVTIPEWKKGKFVLVRESRIKLWNEMGWLVVRRTTADGDLEWQVVLARASDPKRPEIDVVDEGVLRVRYGDYFIRECLHGHLRIFRERKTEQSPKWPPAELQGDRQPLGSDDSTENVRVASWGHDSWCWIECGPLKGGPDLLLRLQPTTQRKGEASRGNAINGVHWAKGGPTEMFYGDSQLQDEGDLFVGTRVDFRDAERGLTEFLLHDRLPGGTPPTITAREWFNVEKPLAISELKGKPVLIGFWANWSASSMSKAPRLQQLHEKFAPRGLVVIGVHAAEKADPLGGILAENRITFPVLIDSGQRQGREFVPGETASRFKVDFVPSFFLIDETGKVVRGYGMGPPTDEQVSELLK